MYSVFLSPSTQPYNLYATSGNEQEYMNKVTDAMEPLLTKNNISYGRNIPDTSVGVSVRESNKGDYDLHLALHSNAAPPDLSGKIRGVDMFYYPTSTYGKAAADILAENMKKLYPIPNLVKAVPNENLYELSKTNSPAVLAELGFHDNVEDEKWIKANVDNIAANLVEAICEYFGINYVK